MKIEVALSPEEAIMLQKLATSPALGPQGNLQDVVTYLISSAVDGVRRPGSWERQWLYQAFGEFS